MRRLPIHAAITAVLLIACSRERPETIFRTVDTDFSSVTTRSILTGTNIETKKTEITLAAYGEEGTLAAYGHFTNNLEFLSLELESGRNYTIYALVNMGDQTTAIPRSESALSTLTYRIPSYSDGLESIASRGIPMAGKISYPGAGTSIPVERLLAKVPYKYPVNGRAQPSARPESANSTGYSALLEKPPWRKIGTNKNFTRVPERPPEPLYFTYPRTGKEPSAESALPGRKARMEMPRSMPGKISLPTSKQLWKGPKPM